MSEAPQKKEFEHAFGFHTLEVPKNAWWTSGFEKARRPKLLCKRCLTNTLNTYDWERTICRMCENEESRQEFALANLWRYADRYWEKMPRSLEKNRVRRGMRKYMLLQMMEAFANAHGVYEGSYDKAFEVHEKTGNHEHVRDLWRELAMEGYIELIGCRVQVVGNLPGEVLRVVPGMAGLWRRTEKEFVAPDEKELEEAAQREDEEREAG